MKKNKPVLSLLFVLAALLLSGCGANRKALYFQNTDAAMQAATAAARYEAMIMPNDILQIVVSAPNPASVEVFNANNTGKEGFGGYLVDEQGYINGFPLIGRIRLGELTKTDACAALRDEIAKQVDLPTVDIRVTNFKVTVLGEVRSPGVYTAESEKLSLPEALGMAGDLTIFGKRKDILLCRTTPEGPVFQRIDITTADLFYSPYFYLQQGDILYVSPNSARTVSGQINPATTLVMSVTNFLIGIVTLILL